MFRFSVFVLLYVLLFSCSHSTEPNVAMSRDEESIRETRALFNQAIANHDTLHIGDSWMNDFLLLTSTNMHVEGKEENIKSFSQHFKDRPDVIYIRTPKKIDVFESWGMASEYGQWEGSWTDIDGKIEVGGTYYAKWHKVENEWRLRAEIYTPTHCQGGEYCTQLKI